VSKQLSNVSQKENIHRRAHWIQRFLEKQEGRLSQKNLQLLYDYNDDMIINSLSENTRYKNLTHFSLLTDMLQKDWADVTEQDLRGLVSQLMTNHGDNGKETGYTFGLKISIKSIVRFVKLRSRGKPEDGELPMIKFIKPKKPKDKLTREDLPTDEEVQKIISVCADSSRDKAMLSVHAEAGTRVGELLGMKIKDFTIDKFGGTIKVDGKTGVRPIRIVKSVPYLTKWLNDHPNKDHDSPLWVYIHSSDTFGQPINYAGFTNTLRKRVKQAGITKRIYSHLFRHKEITDLANRLTESESRMRHGWETSSLMPSRYSHLNQDDLDEKMLGIMGVKAPKEQKESFHECVYCKIRYPIEIRFCDNCSKPLNIVDAIEMEKEQDARTKSLILETMRQEHSNKSKTQVNKKLEEENQQLKKIISKALKNIQ
jgi:integrase/recombinase XerD